jgi:Zn-dependent M32 family carboxypeptidase
MTQISNPNDRVRIKKLLSEISNSMTRIEAERDLIKETIKEMHDEFKIPKRVLNRMAKVYHKQNFMREKEEHMEFEDLYTTVVELNTPQG